MTVKTIVVILLPLILQLIGLTFAALNDDYIQARHRTLLLTIAGIVFSLIVQNYLDAVLASDYVNSVWLSRTIVAVYGYTVRPIIIVLFIRILDYEKKQWPYWLIVIANAAIYTTAFFSKISIYYTEDNHFHRGPLGLSCHIVCAGLLIWLLILASIKYRDARKKDTIIPIATAAMIIVAVLADMFFFTRETQIVSFLTITVVSGCVFFFIWLHLQFVREHEKAMQAEQRIQIMISQIKPHFLFNTLTTIQALCRTDPEKAFETTGKFGTYLRQNIDSLSQERLIPITEEVRHTQVYADIEKIRFPSIEIEYVIKDKDFMVPPLTIQPMVENAIRHGVRIREHGKILVKTTKGKYYHSITIQDNGKGFDTHDIKDFGEDHIGLRNVKNRIETLCGGSMSISSEIGKGTKISIFIPVREEQK